MGLNQFLGGSGAGKDRGAVQYGDPAGTCVGFDGALSQLGGNLSAARQKFSNQGLCVGAQSPVILAGDLDIKIDNRFFESLDPRLQGVSFPHEFLV